MPRLLDRAKIEAANKGFRTLFNDALTRAPRFYERLALVIRSSAPVEIYNWIGGLPVMKKWTGDRQLQRLKAYDFQVKNEHWANGIEVDKDDIRDDKLGLVAPRIRQLAGMAELHKDTLLFDMLVKGFGSELGLALDGQFFFDTDHQMGTETPWSNRGTAALTATSYNAAYQSMLERVDESGEPILATPTHLIVGPKNRATALSILKAERDANGASNINYNTAELVVSQRLVGAYDDYWFLVDLSKEIKPLLLQVREDVEFAAQDDPSDEHVFMRRIYRYGANWEGNAGYGMPHLAWGSDGTT